MTEKPLTNAADVSSRPGRAGKVPWQLTDSREIPPGSPGLLPSIGLPLSYNKNILEYAIKLESNKVKKKEQINKYNVMKIFAQFIQFHDCVGINTYDFRTIVT